MDDEGFHYKVNKTRGGKRYYICATPNVYCKGTAVQLEDGTIKHNKPHTHGPYGEMFNEQEAKNVFRGTLIERSKTETLGLRSIYDEESIRNPHAALLYSWPTAESSMRHARRQSLPPLPSTLRELSEYFDQNAEKYQCNNAQFYQEWVVDNAGKYSVIYACQELISAVVRQGATELHADATFKVVPSTPYCRQLFIIHLILQNHSIPICYVLMEAKTEASYRKVMERFKIKFPEVKPLMIMIDFESALRNVFLYVYPEAQISSCWFHFVQTLQKNIKKMGYSGYIKENREAKMCLRMCSVLPLLPAYQIEQGFQEVKNYAQTHEVILPRFFTYFSSFWLLRKGPESFSVHNQPRRTNNNVESFHSTMKQSFQVMHPNLWTMLENLNNTSKKMHVVVDQLSQGLPTTRNLKFKYILNSQRIKNSTALLNTGAITIKEFLIRTSYSTDRYLTRELHWHEEIEESEEEVEPIVMPIVEYAEAILEDNEEAILEDNEEAILEDNAEVILEDNAGEVINIEEIPEIVEYNEADFIIPEDEELAIWEENYDNEEVHEHEAPYAPIPENIMANLPQGNEDEICVVCRDGPRTHALIPCGHRVLCINCLWQLERQSCPLCNSNFTSFLRIW